ncbi:SusD/RagB family nutrient-binding outer membrane lipoprotein [Sphingobacterium alkalisoli]|uniref:SusD/RagB family nutrient-binding outer membrane lipoprotein n=1 Tax=Sphingobacterium alkalisoli TaxID=1874115 RepID=A0A4U0GUK6_9SPHI|nr:SusD/RagB family nutrient-binding outer membrane lipoprotein [Sphingobacterium alkalisoli]TJY62765.1 SusD/RagB family nutrient-binding outer membrane lipoprotein [Sphingobacterium alkalisoli]GGH28741.1 hypothetical protein GCM10011418_39580 [Sphingobacterium alkalisoli]
MKKIIAAFASIFLLVGCSKFDAINTNPNTPTSVSASMLCTNIILSVTKYNGGDAKSYISENALPKYVGYANEGQLATQYNIIYNGSFGPMTILPDIDKMLGFAVGDPAENGYKGVAHFARAYTFYLLTMRMGDIPFSAANQGEIGNFKPVYDAQKDVFIGILNELEQASAFFAQSPAFEGDPTIFKGDPKKWQRATHAFTLKVLMTLSAKSNDADLRIQQRFAQLVSDNVLLESANDFLGLEYNTVNLHPLYSTNDMFTGRTILSSLVVDHLKQLNDKRLFYFAEPANAQIQAGRLPGDSEAYVGVNAAIDYAAMNTEFSKGSYSKINLRYQTKQNSEPRRLLTYAEQELILAEARVRGWITSGSAEAYYKNGVKAALISMMATDAAYAHGHAITTADIEGYFEGTAAFKNQSSEQLKQIWLQRYLLNFLIDGETAYFEYRRNGYPEFPIDPSTNLNVNSPGSLPLRYLYPSSELNYNSANLRNALDRQFDGYDEINKVMWLLKD